MGTKGDKMKNEWRRASLRIYRFDLNSNHSNPSPVHVTMTSDSETELAKHGNENSLTQLFANLETKLKSNMTPNGNKNK